MRLILVGCEYVGNTTLANAIDDWMDITIGARFSLIHEHWKIPHTSGHPDNTTPELQSSRKCTSVTACTITPTVGPLPT